MKVLKFGGTSIGTPAQIRTALDIIADSASKGRIAVVVSALSGVTDRLIEMANRAAAKDMTYLDLLDRLEARHIKYAQTLIGKENRETAINDLRSLIKELKNLLRGVSLLRHLTPKTLDRILSIGERLSVIIISHSLKSGHIAAEALDARRIIVTDETFGAARVKLDKTYSSIRACFRACSALQVVTGYIAASVNGNTTTLGRSGSDYTAALIGAALNATAIEIWTDVNGVLSADPRKVPEAFTLPYLTYEEAREMSQFGAKVIFPPALRPAIDRNIPILIRNTFQPDSRGTIINNHPQSKKSTVMGFSSLNGITLIRVKGNGMPDGVGIMGRLFHILAKEKINPLFISLAPGDHAVRFAVKTEETQKARAVVEKEFALEIQANMMETIKAENNLSIIAVVGRNMSRLPAISGRVFNALGRNGIKIVAATQGSSERNISIVVNQKDETKAVRSLHDAFFSRT
ncbi:MAG: aspartate kinase [FCB group bacterium]|nr:aspartate kinase [FCB group bacterium]